MNLLVVAFQNLGRVGLDDRETNKKVLQIPDYRI